MPAWFFNWLDRRKAARSPLTSAQLRRLVQQLADGRHPWQLGSPQALPSDGDKRREQCVGEVRDDVRWYHALAGIPPECWRVTTRRTFVEDGRLIASRFLWEEMPEGWYVFGEVMYFGSTDVPLRWVLVLYRPTTGERHVASEILSHSPRFGTHPADPDWKDDTPLAEVSLLDCRPAWPALRAFTDNLPQPLVALARSR